MKHAIPAVSRAQMREVDRLAVEEYGISLMQMMELAGRNLCDLARRLLGTFEGKHIVVLAGSGNNGGGGLVAARHAANRGAVVRVILARPPGEQTGAVARQLVTLRAMGIWPRTFRGDLPDADLYLDCLVGYGVRGALRDAARDLARAANVAGAPVLSLDLPSGLDPDTGTITDVAVRARATMTLALPKHGLLVPDARPWTGELFIADIGLPFGLYGRLGLVVPPLFGGDTIVAFDEPM